MKLPIWYLSLLSWSLVGCPSGSGEFSTRFTGTVATGAPLTGVNVSVFDRTGQKVKTVQSDSQGHYDTGALSNDSAPYIVQAENLEDPLYSVQATAGLNIVNITPHTHLIATLLSPTGNAANLADEVKTDASLITPQTVADKKAIVQSVIQPVTDALHLTVDPISSSFEADGQSYDRVLDSTQITIIPALINSTQSSNIQVTYKTKLDLTDANKSNLKSVGFNSTATSVDVSQISLTEADLLDVGQMTKIKTWVDRYNNCSRLDPAQRRSGNAGVKVVIASICQDLFYSGNIHTFKSNGVDIETLFGVFGDGIYTTDVLSDAEYVFEINTNGTPDIYIKLKALGSSGVTTNYFFSLSPDPAHQNELRWRGNGYQFRSALTSYNQIRYFPFSPEYAFTMSGFRFWIPNKDDAGHSLNYDKVVVTSPTGDRYFLKDPGPSISTLVLCRTETTPIGQCGTDPWYTLRSDFLSIDATRPFARPVQYQWNGNLDYGQKTNAELQSIPMYGIFKFEFYLNGNTTPVVQYMPYYGRPKTQPEIVQARSNGLFPKFTDASVFALLRDFPYKDIVAPGDGSPFNLEWTGKADFFNIFGHVFDTANGSIRVNSYEITGSVSPNDHSKLVACSSNSAQEHQCLASPDNATFAVAGVNASNYFTIATSLMIGNSFSDFSTNYTLFGFFDIENSPAW